MDKKIMLRRMRRSPQFVVGSILVVFLLFIALFCLFSFIFLCCFIFLFSFVFDLKVFVSVEVVFELFS